MCYGLQPVQLRRPAAVLAHARRPLAGRPLLGVWRRVLPRRPVLPRLREGDQGQVRGLRGKERERVTEGGREGEGEERRDGKREGGRKEREREVGRGGGKEGENKTGNKGRGRKGEKKNESEREKS